MAQISHLKSTPLTNLDASPVVTPSSGEGGEGVLRNVEGNVVAVAADSIATTYQLVRVPSNAKVKAVRLESAAQGAGTVDIGAYYATDKGPALLLANTIVAAFFASAIDLSSAYPITNVTNESGTYPIDKRNQPLWQALGLTTDPGGNIDIVATVVSVAVTTGTGRIGLSVDYVI